MTRYTENIYKLKALFTLPATQSQNSRGLCGFDKHRKAKVLATLLANATLATPKLNRSTVVELLDGEAQWPKVDGTFKSININVDLAQLEELGLVSFYADWCRIHYRSLGDESLLHDSVKPLIEAVDMLMAIKYGNNGYIKPYYTIDMRQAQSLTKDIAETTYLAQLDEINVCNQQLVIHLPEAAVSKLLSAYLWSELRAIMLPKEAFVQWIQVMCAYTPWAIAPTFDHFEHEEKKRFIDEGFDFILLDQTLNSAWPTLINQWRLERGREQIFIKSETIVHMPINLQDDKKVTARPPETHTEGIPLNEVMKNNTVFDESFDSALAFAAWSQTQDYWYGESHFYSDVISAIANHDIYIDQNSISDYDRLSKLLDVADSRPVLQHILIYSLPHYSQSSDYLLYLLSTRKFSAVALYLIHRTVSGLFPHTMINTTSGSLHHFYWPLACEEFLAVTLKEAESADYANLVSLIIQLIKLCDFKYLSRGHATTLDCLNILLEKLTKSQVEGIAEGLLASITAEKSDSVNGLPFWPFYLLFWLLEKEQVNGVLVGSDFGDKVQRGIIKIYIDAFNANVDSKYSVMGAADFFDTLPWQRLDDTQAIDSLLSLIKNPALWTAKLANNHEPCLSNQILLSGYFQLLLCLYTPDRAYAYKLKILNKVLDIISAVGFLDGAYYSLFVSYLTFNKYNLWSRFANHIDWLEDSVFARVIEVVSQGIPINNLLELYKKTSKQKRKDQLAALIASVQLTEQDDAGLGALEDALVLACETGQIPLANELLIAAKKQLETHPYQQNRYFKESKNRWLMYDYKLAVLEHFDKHSGSVDEKTKTVTCIENPFKRTNTSNDIEVNYYLECEWFRRFIMALEWFNTKPLKTYNWLNQLCKETKNKQYVRDRFAAILKYLETIAFNISPYTLVLTEYMDAEGDCDIASLEPVFVANLMECHLKMKNPDEVEVIWSQCSPAQQHHIAVATRYCQALKEKGKHHKAQNVFTQLERYHQQDTLDEDAQRLLNELDELIVNDQTPSSLIAITRKIDNQRKTTEELSRYYGEIGRRSLDERIEIIEGKPIAPAVFLCEQIIRICNELLFRKKNLQQYETEDKQNKRDHKITKEDLINDWFNSLFNHRCAYMGLNCVDQRGGQSATAKSVGEIDGVISFGDQRIAMMEAFRLFSNSNKVIKEHLDKIAGYNPESLSPVIILAYCDVADFSALAKNYQSDLKSRQYVGFDPTATLAHTIEVVENKADKVKPSLKVYKEIRHRDDTPICFYHFLLDLRD